MNTDKSERMERMEKALIYGSGITGRQVYQNIKQEIQVLGFLDGNKEKKGHEIIDGVKCLGGVEELGGLKYDRIYIGSIFWNDIKSLLLNAGVPDGSIVVDIPEDTGSPIRNTWLECYSRLFADTALPVAEGGVFRGEFAKVINKSFPKSKLYLFDTFDGFDKRDVDYEKNKYSFNLKEGEFSNTSVELVMSKMTYPENVVVRQGFFPETATGIDEKFCFVNLDFDLHMPILEGLRFFYPKMVDGTALLIHDYYNIALPGVKDAVDDYEKEIGKKLIRMPIGDDQSIAIIKQYE